MKSQQSSTRFKAPDLSISSPTLTNHNDINDGIGLNPHTQHGRPTPDIDVGNGNKFIQRKLEIIVSTFNVQTLN